MDQPGRRGAGDRLVGLEVLRFLAALGVLVWHYQHFLFVGHDRIGWDPDRLPFRWLFAPFYTYGYAGVELFWCISGFIFTWKYGSVISRGGLSFGRFVWLRFSRLYPLHFATLLAVASLQPLYFTQHGQDFVYLFNDARHFVLSLFFANWWGFQSGESFNGPSWSVSAEILIYVAFFAITRAGLAGRPGAEPQPNRGTRGALPRVNWNRIKCLGRIVWQAGWLADLMAVLGFSIIAWIAKARFGISLGFTGAGTFFFLGALTLRLYRWVDMHGSRWRPWIGWVCAATIIATIGLVGMQMLKIAGASLAMYPAAVLLAQLVIRPRGVRSRLLLTNLGNLTYASYMLHFPLQLTAMLAFGMLAVPVQSLAYQSWFMLAYLGTVFTAAFFVFRWVEQPTQTLLRRIKS